MNINFAYGCLQFQLTQSCMPKFSAPAEFVKKEKCQKIAVYFLKGDAGRLATLLSGQTIT